jgi:transposase
VASNIVGVSGRSMLAAMLAGEDDPEVLTRLARGRLREKERELQEALLGEMGPHQRFLLQRQLRRLDELERDIAEVSEEVARRLAPFGEVQGRLETIPGVGRRLAETILGQGR